jgi:hypothetical protein
VFPFAKCGDLCGGHVRPRGSIPIVAALPESGDKGLARGLAGCGRSKEELLQARVSAS